MLHLQLILGQNKRLAYSRRSLSSCEHNDIKIAQMWSVCMEVRFQGQLSIQNGRLFRFLCPREEGPWPTDCSRSQKRIHFPLSRCDAGPGGRRATHPRAHPGRVRIRARMRMRARVRRSKSRAVGWEVERGRSRLHLIFGAKAQEPLQ